MNTVGFLRPYHGLVLYVPFPAADLAQCLGGDEELLPLPEGLLDEPVLGDVDADPPDIPPSHRILEGEFHVPPVRCAPIGVESLLDHLGGMPALQD